MKFNLLSKAFMATCACLALSAAPVQAAPVNYTLAGASPGGLWTLLGAGLDAAVKAGNPGSTVTYQTSGGGFANALLVQQGRAQLGLIHDAEIAIAVKGAPPFEHPMERLRTIGYMYNWAPMQFIANKAFADKYGISSLDDFAKVKAPVRITVNRAGNITGQIATAMLDAAGASRQAIESWGGSVIPAGSSEQSTLFQNGRIDVFTNGVFVGHSSIRELENTVDIKVLTVPKSVRDTVGQEYGIGPFVIKAGSYKNQDKPVETLTLGAVLVVSSAMPDDEAYRLTKSIIDNIDKIRAVHPSMQALTPQLLATKTAAPIHPGALKAFREAGLMK